jgi:uncharacterized membrane protein
MTRTRYIAQGGLIAAIYAGLTLLAMQMLSVFAFGPIQLRLSEAFTVVAFFTPAAIPGLALGSVVANLYTLVITGNPLALLDVGFGSLGTLLGAVWTWRFRRKTALGLAGPVIANALIVPAYLPWLLKGLGLYQVPVLGIDLEGRWLPMYLFGVVTVGLGQAVVMYGPGLLLLWALRRLPRHVWTEPPA